MFQPSIHMKPTEKLTLAPPNSGDHRETPRSCQQVPGWAT